MCEIATQPELDSEETILAGEQDLRAKVAAVAAPSKASRPASAASGQVSKRLRLEAEEPPPPPPRRKREDIGNMDEAITMESMRALMSECGNTAGQKVANELRVEFASLRTELKNDMNGITVRLDSHDRRFVDLEKRFNAQSTTASSNEGRGGGGGTRRHANGNSYDREPYHPRAIEIKGFLEDFDTRTGAIESEEALEYLRAAFASVTVEDREIIDQAATENLAGRVKHIKLVVKLKPKQDRADIKKLKIALQEYCENHPINGRTIRAVIEGSPEMKAIFQVGAKAMSVLEKSGVTRARMKPEWEIGCCRIYYNKPADDHARATNELVATYSDRDGEWAVQEGALGRMGSSLTAADFIRRSR